MKPRNTLKHVGPHAGQRGYALLLVLWGLSLLSLLAITLMGQNRLAVRGEANAWRELQLEQSAAAATALGVLALYEAETHAEAGLYGAPRPFEFDGISGEISIQDELGKIDINYASEEQLRRLMSSAGASPNEAQQLARHIVEWRNIREGRRSAAKAAEEYLGENRQYEPRGAPFQSTDELKLVLGMRDDIFKAVESGVTVYSHSPAFDPQAAPEIVLRSAAGMNAAQITEILQARANHGDSENGAASGRRISLDGRAFSIIVDVTDRSGRNRRYETIIRLTGDPNHSFWLLARQ